VAWLALALLAVSCGSDDETGPPDREPTPLDLTTTGALRVTVSYTGAVPESQAVNMSGVPACAAAHPGGVRDDSLLVSDGRLANAVVWIKEGLGDRVFATATAPVVIDQKGCLYVPRVSAVMVGQPVTFVNSDPEGHNVHGRPEVARGWNFLMSRQTSRRTIIIDKAEVAIQVGCDIHPWMRAHIATFEHPYFAVTPPDGRVTLDRVPPGHYVVAVWHERLGTLERSVSVPPRGTLDLTLTYAAE
jgi:plastocyanin